MNRVLLSILIVVLAAPAALAGDEDFAVREKGGPKPEPKADQASVYVVRPANVGRAIRIWAFADEQSLGMTKSNTYTHHYLDPGTYIFWAKAENVSAEELTVEAGKTYFLKQKVKVGVLKARVKVEFLSEDEGWKALEECEKHSTLTDAGIARAEEIVSEDYAKAREKAAED